MKQEHKQFYKDVLDGLQSHSLAIFAGAGLSKAAGFVDWKGLLKDIADDLGLSIDLEDDLISLAQYNENKVGGRSMLNQKIISEFNEVVELTENHNIIARLPIHTYWTTNYDDLIERALNNAKKVTDIKHCISQLNFSRPKRDAIVYKMHGDATLPNEATLTKDDYERYFNDKAPFITALSGDLVSKLFLFIGFSFTDPNLDFILSRVRFYMKSATRHHYYFVKRIQQTDSGVKDKVDFEYKLKKQQLFIDDLRRFKLQPVYVDSYTEITAILNEIETLYKKKTVLISGSAEEYGIWSQEAAQQFIHKLSSRLIKENLRIVNGFGWGVGSAVINGALEQIYSKPEKFHQDQLMIKPFPQFKTGNKELKQLWTEYRHTMVDYAGLAIFMFGNRKDDKTGNIIKAEGMKEEFEIAKSRGLFLLPIKATGYLANDLYALLKKENYYTSTKNQKIIDSINLMETATDQDIIIEQIILIIKTLNE